MVIEAGSISFAFGERKALRGVCLEVREGEIFGLVGPDGAGKTTLVRILAGILRPGEGSLSILGSGDPEKVRDRLGMIPQAFTLYGDLTVWENIRLFGALYGAAPREVEEKGREILTFTNLLPFGDRLADALSGGMKRKLALAAGLMHSPRLFILDEPTTGVDPVSRREIWKLLYDLNRRGLTIFVTTPYMDEAELCTRTGFLHEGRLLACDSPKALCEAFPGHVLEVAVPVRDLRPLLSDVPVREINAFGNAFHLVVDDPASAGRQVREALERAGVQVLSLREIPPSLEDAFVEMATGVA